MSNGERGLGILEGEGVLGRINGGRSSEGVLGYGMVGKAKNSIMMRVDNTKRTATEAKDIIMGGSWRPFAIITEHIQGLRNANQELRPNVLLK